MVKPKKWNPEIKKQQIIEAAIKVLNKKEYFRVPVDEVAKQAGVAKGTIYLYFKSKEEIYFSVLFALMDKLIEIIDSVRKTEISATKQLAMLLEKMVDFTSSHRQIFNALRSEVGPHKDKFHNALLKKMFEINQSMSEIVRNGILNNEFKDYPPALISGVFFSATTLIFHQQIEQDKTFPPIPPDMLFEILLKGFGK
ncbi:MAG: TetR/AcrR family transcriptional regulator [Elusimicrobiota bacterium]